MSFNNFGQKNDDLFVINVINHGLKIHCCYSAVRCDLWGGGIFFDQEYIYHRPIHCMMIGHPLHQYV